MLEFRGSGERIGVLGMYRRIGVTAYRRAQRMYRRIGVTAYRRAQRMYRRIGVTAYRRVSRKDGKFMKAAKHFRDLDAYQNAMTQVMQVFGRTKKFPADEKFALTEQVRRSSRSVCANIAEAWRKRRYQAAFVAKLNDAEAEAAETQVHLEIAFRNGYIDQDTFHEFDDAYEKVIGQLVKMIDQAPSWTIRARHSQSRD